MLRYVFMTEERSMEEALKNILPKISNCFSDRKNYHIIPHEGKQDLEKSIPKKLRAWKDNKDFQYKFILIRDKDSGDCIQIKKNLSQICINAGREDVLIRIVVHELESWFLGDLKAIDVSYCKNISKHKNSKKYRDPDSLANPSQELANILNSQSKISWAKNISKHMDMSLNTSTSFNIFVSGMSNMLRKNA